MKYYFRYEGQTANVYHYSKQWEQEFLVAKFTFGKDAQEYVDMKNALVGA